MEVCDGEGTRLVALWVGADRAIVIDAVRSGRPPGEVLRVDLRGDRPDGVAQFAGDWRGSSHAFGLASAVSLARALGRLPRALTVYGIEGEAFEYGTGLSPTVHVAVARVAADIMASL
jgi:hydrogenase maturation protease